jgi:hypothetical protein
MKLMLDRFYPFLSQPLIPRTRVALAVLPLALTLAFAAPLWRISMEAPQYPRGLVLDIYSYKLAGGNDGQHLQEINTLNHYIGMRPLERKTLADLDWMPFAIGALALLAWRVAAIGTVRDLADLTVATIYFSLFAFGRFAYQLYVFGHDLSPDAPVTVAPFMPVLLGSKQVANFVTHSFPQLGSLGMGIFLGGLVLILGLHLSSGRRQAVKEERERLVLVA